TNNSLIQIINAMEKLTKRMKRKLWIIPLSLLTACGYNHIYAAAPLISSPLQMSERDQTGVSGKVTDERTGEPVIGATITIKGTTIATQTGEQGDFSIEASKGQVLTATFVGYSQVEVEVGDGPINIRLTPEGAVLEELVVVGYGTMRKSDVTGSISMVKGEDMVKAQNFSPLENLRGQAAGVNIYSNSSQPGAYANRVVIRGQATINSSSSPLYVVDGVVMENFHLLNPNDIDHIEVLKDASSAAIYGARGAGGVILVTTKRGSKDGRKTMSYQDRKS